jgi:sugar O-acyltransferase (sialic acid O-acetyltransferase NeuD family)
VSVLYVVGAGGHGKVVADAAHRMGLWAEIRFIDKRWPELENCAHWPVVANDIAACEVGSDFIVAIGHNQTRLRVFDECVAAGLNPVTIIHPHACISAFASIEMGSVVFAGVVVNIGAVVERCAILNTGATVDHDCKIGVGVHVSPGAHLAGEVSVGDYSWIGIGASVKQCLNIGSNVIVGAGAAVVSDVMNDKVAVGVPAANLS